MFGQCGPNIKAYVSSFIIVNRIFSPQGPSRLVPKSLILSWLKSLRYIRLVSISSSSSMLTYSICTSLNAYPMFNSFSKSVFKVFWKESIVKEVEVFLKLNPFFILYCNLDVNYRNNPLHHSHNPRQYL